MFTNNQFKGYLWFDDYVPNATQCLHLFYFLSSLYSEKNNYFKRFFKKVNESPIRWRWSIKSFRWVKFVTEKLNRIPKFTVDGTCCRSICIVCDRIKDECSSDMSVGGSLKTSDQTKSHSSKVRRRMIECKIDHSSHHSYIKFLGISNDRNELCSDHYAFVFIFIFLTLNSWVIGCCHIWFIFKQPKQFTANKFVK